MSPLPFGCAIRVQQACFFVRVLDQEVLCIFHECWRETQTGCSKQDWFTWNLCDWASKLRPRTGTADSKSEITRIFANDLQKFSQQYTKTMPAGNDRYRRAAETHTANFDIARYDTLHFNLPLDIGMYRTGELAIEKEGCIGTGIRYEAKKRG